MNLVTHRSGGSAHQNDPVAKGGSGGALPAGGGRALPPSGRLESRKPFPCWRLLPGLGGALGSGLWGAGVGHPGWFRTWSQCSQRKVSGFPINPRRQFLGEGGAFISGLPQGWGWESSADNRCSISAPRVDLMAQEDVYFSSSMLCDVILCYGDW